MYWGRSICYLIHKEFISGIDHRFRFPKINFYSTTEYEIAKHTFSNLTKNPNIFTNWIVRESSFPIKIYYWFLNHFYISTFRIPVVYEMVGVKEHWNQFFWKLEYYDDTFCKVLGLT